MLLVSYRARGALGPWRAGVADGAAVVDAAGSPESGAAPGRDGVPMRALLEQGAAAVEAVLAWAQTQFDAGTHVSLAEHVEIGPPLPDPDKIICLGLNYRDHAVETQLDVPTVPLFFAKFRNSLTGPTSPILLPSVSDQVDYEGELAVVIGRRCKAISASEALTYVAGYSVLNDVSARDIQFRTSEWTAGKALDTFAPMGPGIVPASNIPDPQALTLTTWVNGQTVQRDSTANMIFSVAAAIAYLSSLMTLEVGDIIATGTPSGVGFKRTPPLFLQAGDVVEVEIERIGRIHNPVMRAQ